MTDKEREQVIRLRQQGYGYVKIAPEKKRNILIEKGKPLHQKPALRYFIRNP